MRRNEKIAKSVIIAGSLFWMVMGVWGINLSFEAAKETRDQYIQELKYSRGIATINFDSKPEQAPWRPLPSSEDHLKLQMERAGIPESPYVFEEPTIKALFVSALCVIVSFFVFYSVFVISPRRYFPIPDSKTWSSYEIKE